MHVVLATVPAAVGGNCRLFGCGLDTAKSICSYQLVLSWVVGRREGDRSPSSTVRLPIWAGGFPVPKRPLEWRSRLLWLGVSPEISWRLRCFSSVSPAKAPRSRWPHRCLQPQRVVFDSIELGCSDESEYSREMIPQQWPVDDKAWWCQRQQEIRPKVSVTRCLMVPAATWSMCADPWLIPNCSFDGQLEKAYAAAAAAVAATATSFLYGSVVNVVQPDEIFTIQSYSSSLRRRLP